MKYNRILFYVFILLILGLLIYISQKSTVSSYVRNHKLINILCIGSTEDELDSLLIINYDPSAKDIMVFPVMPYIKILNNNSNLYYRFSKLFSRYYRINNKDMHLISKSLCEDVEKYAGIKIPFYIHISSSSFSHISDRFKSYNNTALYRNIFNIEHNESSYSTQFDSIISLSKIFSDIKSFPIFRKTLKHITTNITILDAIVLFTQPKEYHNIIFVCRPDNSETKINGIYIKDTISNIKKLPTSSVIKVEVLNSSKETGLAYKTTNILRSNGIDVQSWGNYGNYEQKTMIIDRRGNWYNAKKVADIIGYGIVFSYKNDNSFVDVSVILGMET